MRVAEGIVSYLGDLGIGEVFVVYGSACGELVDAFSRVEGVRYICAHSEQGAGFMADGYARIRGMGAVIVTSGPGGTNLLTAIASSYYESTPVIYITGQVNSRFLRRGRERQCGFQENDIVSMAKPITKLAIRLEPKDNVMGRIRFAVSEACEGRPGPVLIDIPMDIQNERLR